MTDPENSGADAELSIEQQLNLQTAKISWHELERFFATGKAVYVDASLDLIEVASAVHNDDATQIQALMNKGTFAAVTDAQALAWHDTNTAMWAVVVSPWVLVQPAS